MPYGLKWSAEICWIGAGTSQMDVPSAQVLKVTQKNVGGIISLASTSVNTQPTTTNVSTACTTAGTNMATALNANIGQIQGFATGGG